MGRRKKQDVNELPADPRECRAALDAWLKCFDITPLDIFNASMREYWHEAERYRQASEMAVMCGDVNAAVQYHEEKFKMIEKAITVAVKAAPYIHPRLMSTNATVDTGPVQIEIVQFGEKIKKQLEGVQ